MSFHPFPQTRWTLLLSAKGEGVADDSSAKAMEELACAYWKPVYAYLRGKGHGHEEAQDQTQAFFAQLIHRDFLRNLKPQGGRFRSFLLVSLRHHLIDAHRLASNRKREEEIPLESWHESEFAVRYPMTASPEEAFDRTWAEALIARAMAQLEKRWSRRPELFAEIRYTVENSGNVTKYAEIGRRHGMTEGAVCKAVHDLRRQFSEQIRQEIRDTVADDTDVEEELRYLVRLLRN